jgi:hypothetical protein
MKTEPEAEGEIFVATLPCHLICTAEKNLVKQ